MGTTGVAALFYQGMLHVANVGDSRAYLIRNDEICQVSRDHSLVGEQVAAGVAHRRPGAVELLSQCDYPRSGVSG
jgi:Serine/threonine protein phosphatase